MTLTTKADITDSLEVCLMIIRKHAPEGTSDADCTTRPHKAVICCQQGGQQ